MVSLLSIFGRLLLFNNVVFSLSFINMEHEKLLILGYGRVGEAVAKVATLNNFPLVGSVIGTKRTIPMGTNIESYGNNNIRQIQFDSQEIPSLASQCRYLLVTIPATVNDDNSSKQSHGTESIDTMFQNIVNELPSNSWIGIISTTGIYGDHEGSWVTEDSECKCLDNKFLQYEAKWISWANECNLTLHIFRCAGIYSDDQSALHTVYRNGYESKTSGDNNPISDEKSKTNRIHVLDIAQAVVAAMRIHSSHQLQISEHNYRIFNLADNLPENRLVVFDYAAKLLMDMGFSVSGMKQQERQSKMIRTTDNIKRGSRRQTDRKLVSNSRMLKELLPDIGLRFPTYKEGLLSIINNKENPWWKQ